MDGTSRRGAVRVWPIVFLIAMCAGPSWAQERAEPDEPDSDDRTPCASSPVEARYRSTDDCGKKPEERDEHQRQVTVQAAAEEQGTRTSFLQRLHFDGLWMPSSTAGGVYGVIGAHLVIATIGRVHLFGPPGAMLMLDNTRGSWQVRPGLTWGVSIHLTDVRMPGASRDAGLLFTLAKVWTFGDERTGADMAGLSLNWK